MHAAAYLRAVGLAALAAWPAHATNWCRGSAHGAADRAPTILYATAASQSRIDGFRVSRDGGLAPTPVASVTTAGTEPRRLLVAGRFLYVAQLDRVEVFEIGCRGGLKKVGGTEVLKNMEAVDIATSPDGTFLYVAERGPDQIAAYPVGPNGAPATKEAKLTSCVQGENNASFLTMVVRPGLLYVSGAGAIRGIDVFPINADGSLPATPENCVRSGSMQTRSTPTEPLSCRKRLGRPRGLIVDENNRLYVEDKTRSRIFAFALQPDGTFSPKPALCTQSSRKKKEQQSTLSKTNVVAAYEQLLLSGSTVLGIQFQRGRVDAYRIKADADCNGCLGRVPAHESAEDVRTSPVRGAVRDDVLYVAAGELDRVRAFRLCASDSSTPGMLAAPNFFSQTAEQTGSFPNDVAVVPDDVAAAVLSDQCQ